MEFTVFRQIVQWVSNCACFDKHYIADECEIIMACNGKLSRWGWGRWRHSHIIEGYVIIQYMERGAGRREEKERGEEEGERIKKSG